MSLIGMNKRILKFLEKLSQINTAQFLAIMAMSEPDSVLGEEVEPAEMVKIWLVCEYYRENNGN